MHILEAAQSDTLTIDTSTKAAKLALKLLANASAHISRERRKLALKDLNKDLLILAKDDDIFSEVAPMLFRDGFEKMMKEHVEAMRCIRKTSHSKNESFFFSEGPSQYHHYHGGGNNHRGRGRYHPYRSNFNGQNAG